LHAAFEETGGASWDAVDSKYIFHVMLESWIFSNLGDTIQSIQRLCISCQHHFILNLDSSRQLFPSE
jgi:hypothetical protein